MLGQGTILGNRYRIVNHIGNGGSGNVYLAMDIHIGKNWAIKQIKLQNGKEKILAANEVKMMKQLDYKMFPRIIDAWQEDEDYFIVSDYIEGVSMDWLLKYEKVPVSTAILWCRELAEALEYLHGCIPPILYLDMKPENVMVKADGTLCLVDFGIAQRIAEPGHKYGTPGYAAPEQYLCNSNIGDRKKSLGASTDIFSLGMTLYARMI